MEKLNYLWQHFLAGILIGAHCYRLKNNFWVILKMEFRLRLKTFSLAATYLWIWYAFLIWIWMILRYLMLNLKFWHLQNQTMLHSFYIQNNIMPSPVSLPMDLGFDSVCITYTHNFLTFILINYSRFNFRL